MFSVILIDDEKFVLASLEGRIKWRECGFEVVGKAYNAAMGYELIRELQPDVVFTDIKMPGMSGIKLIENASIEFPKTKFVVISGYNEFEYAKKAIEYGVIGFCVKPFDEEEISGILFRIKSSITENASKKSTDMIKYIGINLEENTEKRSEILEQNGIMPCDPKVILVAPIDCIIEFSKKVKMLEFPFDRAHSAYIISTDSRENIILNLQHVNKVGLSNSFCDMSCFDAALEEAKISSYQCFINGKPFNTIKRPFNTNEIAKSIKAMRKYYDLRELIEIHTVFDELVQMFETDILTIKDAFRIYNSTLAISGENTMEYCEDYSQLINRFQDVNEMLHILEEIAIKNIIEPPEKMDKSKPINDILTYINEHYYDCNLTVQTVSDMLGFNSNYISQLFKKSEAENFTAYLTTTRIEHAKNLLERSEYPIRLIGEKVGYPDYFYFAKVFKKYVKRTPGDYRNQIKANLDNQRSL